MEFLVTCFLVLCALIMFGPFLFPLALVAGGIWIVWRIISEIIKDAQSRE